MFTNAPAVRPSLSPRQLGLARTLCDALDTMRDEGRQEEARDLMSRMATLAAEWGIGLDWTALTNL